MSQIQMVTKRTKEQLEQIEKEYTSFLLYPDFVLLNSPMGIILTDTQHPDFKKIVQQCIVYVKMFGDNQAVKEYEALIN